MIFKFKKSLGQHFLKDTETLKKIASLKNIENQVIVEIGPGKGALTKMILKQNPKKLIVVEKDKTLQPYLIKIKNNHPKTLEIIFDDVLSIDFNKLDNNKLILLANLPYNIASKLILNLLKNSKIFRYLIVMVQKEVAERFSAKVSSKAYSRISILAQLQSDIKKYFDVSPEKFFPKPNVTSSVIEIIPAKKYDFDYQKLDQILKVSFRQRRKTIKNNLKNLKKFSEKEIINCGVDPNLRPQNIKPEDYIKLSDALI